MWICQNDLDFSLYAMQFVCCMSATSDKWMKSKMKVSANVGMSLLNTRD